jgi:Mg2+/Co2+ transporter CorB
MMAPHGAGELHSSLPLSRILIQVSRPLEDVFKELDRAFAKLLNKTAAKVNEEYSTNELRTVSQPTLNIKQLSETTVVLPIGSSQTGVPSRITS